MCQIVGNLWPLLLVCSLWLAAGSTSQAEEMYQISESELIQLERDLNQLEKSNANKQDLLTEQKTQLSEAKTQLETVQKELIASKSLNEATQKSLERANQSLTELENEARHKVQVKARQRNLWIGATALMMYAYIKGK